MEMEIEYVYIKVELKQNWLDWLTAPELNDRIADFYSAKKEQTNQFLNIFRKNKKQNCYIYLTSIDAGTEWMCFMLFVVLVVCIPIANYNNITFSF